MSADLPLLLPEPPVAGQPGAAAGLQPHRAGLLCAGGLSGHQTGPEIADTARSDLSPEDKQLGGEAGPPPQQWPNQHCAARWPHFPHTQHT